MAEVGWAGALLYNERTKRLVDGHARRKLFSGRGKVPVLVGSWDEATEKKILATLDPLTTMAECSRDALDSLLRDVRTGSEAIAGVLTDLAGLDKLDLGSPPPSVDENARELDRIKAERRAANSGTAEKNDTEKYLVIVYASRGDKEKALSALGLPADERYISAASIELKPRGPILPSGHEAASVKKSGAGG